MTTAKKKFVCPECNAKFDFAKTLGSHRLFSHGVAGTSVSARRAQELKANMPPRPKGPFSCPDCEFIAVNKAGMTIHRKAKHGAASESKTAIAIRANGDPLQCPDCEFHALSKIGLANHRNRMHGVASASTLAIRKREERTNIKAKKRGLPIEPAQTITAFAIASPNGYHPQEAHFDPDGIPEATLALTLGRFQELCFSVAKEHDLPPRRFAAKLAKLIYATTLR